MPKRGTSELLEPNQIEEYEHAERPRIIVFDLDGTLWEPEMYQLSGGAPFKAHPSQSDVMIDRAGTNVHLIGETREVLQELCTAPEWRSTFLAISSTCDIPVWAKQLLEMYKFKNTEGKEIPMKTLFGDRREIYYANKADQHRTILQKVHEEDVTVNDFRQMLFFDNQRDNCRSVSSLGVTCCYCPRGLTKGMFEQGLTQWKEQKHLVEEVDKDYISTVSVSKM